MPERLECEVLQKTRYINTLTFRLYILPFLHRAAYAAVRCPSVCTSVHRASVLYRNEKHILIILQQVHTTHERDKYLTSQTDRHCAME